MPSAEQKNDPGEPKRRDETIAFLFLAFVLFPLLAIIFVGGYGFIIWMQQLMFGPPGT